MGSMVLLDIWIGKLGGVASFREILDCKKVGVVVGTKLLVVVIPSKMNKVVAMTAALQAAWVSRICCLSERKKKKNGFCEVVWNKSRCDVRSF